MEGNKKEKWKAFGFIAIVILFLVNLFTSMSSSDSTPTRSTEFNWNDEEDVQDFIDWKEDNGTGWSDN